LARLLDSDLDTVLLELEPDSLDIDLLGAKLLDWCLRQLGPGTGVDGLFLVVLGKVMADLAA